MKGFLSSFTKGLFSRDLMSQPFSHAAGMRPNIRTHAQSTASVIKKDPLLRQTVEEAFENPNAAMHDSMGKVRDTLDLYHAKGGKKAAPPSHINSSTNMSGLSPEKGLPNKQFKQSLPTDLTFNITGKIKTSYNKSKFLENL